MYAKKDAIISSGPNPQPLDVHYFFCLLASSHELRLSLKTHDLVLSLLWSLLSSLLSSSLSSLYLTTMTNSAPLKKNFPHLCRHLPSVHSQTTQTTTPTATANATASFWTPSSCLTTCSQSPKGCRSGKTGTETETSIFSSLSPCVAYVASFFALCVKRIILLKQQKGYMIPPCLWLGASNARKLLSSSLSGYKASLILIAGQFSTDRFICVRSVALRKI